MNRLALPLGVLCLVIAATALWRGETARRGDAAERRAQQEALDSVRDEVDALAAQVRAMPLFPARRAPTRAGDPLPASGPDLSEVLAQMESLHKRVSALEARLDQARQRAERPPPTAAEIAAAQSVALDRQAPARNRIDALKTLRRTEHGRTREVSLAMLELIHASDVPPDLRSDAVSELKGLRFPELKDPMVGLLGKLDHEDTRKEAVQVLRGYLDDPGVLAAVTRARDHDPSSDVRGEAKDRIEEWQAGKEWNWRGK
jgi:hypothetical protein